MSATDATTSQVFGVFPRRYLDIVISEAPFLAIILGCFLVAALTYQTPAIAAWVGFAFAAYAATTNDSIQTIGTFLASNSHRRWWVLWLFIATILVITISYSWWAFDGDVSFQRLASKGFETAPTSFSYLQVVAPVFLLVLTRMRVPVSTTFLCLSGFAASTSSIGSVLLKSVSGYGIAFVVSIVVWLAITKLARTLFTGAPAEGWFHAQWAISGMLWSVWLMQDAANVAVYLPRQLSFIELLGFLGVMLGGLLVLFYLKGDRIQSVVTEKTNIIDVRAATLVDVSYVAILIYFQKLNNIPMSTTWVFIGLLAGRELAIAIAAPRADAEQPRFSRAGKIVARDLLAVTIGLVVSLIIAASVNDVFLAEILAFAP